MNGREGEMEYEIVPGDLAKQEYATGISGVTALLRGIVVHVGEWEGTPTYSVIGYDSHGKPASTSSSTMPIHFVASRLSMSARNMMRRRLADSSGRVRERLERIAVEEMGM